MGIKLTLAEAEAAGYQLATEADVLESKAITGGVQLEALKDGYICYIGPCHRSQMRTVCYYRSDVGCHVCYLEPDSSCGPT